MILLCNFIEGANGLFYSTNYFLLQAVIGIWFAASHQSWIVSSPWKHETHQEGANSNFELEPSLHFLWNLRPSRVRGDDSGRDGQAKFPWLGQSEQATYSRQLHQGTGSSQPVSFAHPRRLHYESFREKIISLRCIRRKAVQLYQSSDGGPSLAIGDVACFPGRDMMHDESKYPNADESDGASFHVQPYGVCPAKGWYPANHRVRDEENNIHWRF